MSSLVGGTTNFNFFVRGLGTYRRYLKKDENPLLNTSFSFHFNHKVTERKINLEALMRYNIRPTYSDLRPAVEQRLIYTDIIKLSSATDNTGCQTL